MHPALPLPLRLDALSPAVAHKITFQPGGQTVLALRAREPIGHQHQNPVGQRPARRAPGRRCDLIQDRVQTQLAPQLLGHEHRAPDRRLLRAHPLERHPGRRRRSAQQTHQRFQVRGQKVFAAQIGDDPLLGMSVFPVGFDQAHVLIGGTPRAARFDGAKAHKYDTRIWREYGGKSSTTCGNRFHTMKYICH